MSVSLNSEPATLPQLLALRAREMPDATSQRRKIRGVWRRYSWAEVEASVRHMALGLVDLGLRRGEIVVVIGENRPELLWAEFAIQAAGGVCVCLYPDATAEEMLFILRDTGAVHIFAEDQEQVDKVLAIKAHAPRLGRIVHWDGRGLWNYREPALLELADLQATGAARDRAAPGAFAALIAAGRGADVALLSYTSGTTGEPKGVICTHEWLIGNTRRVLAALPFRPGCQYLSYISPAWGPEQSFGVTAGLLVPMVVNFSETPEQILRNIRELAVEALAFSPRQWESLAGSVRTRMLAGGRLRRWLVDHGLAIGRAVNVNRLEGRRRPWLARLLYPLVDQAVLRPLRDKLGLTRATVALCGGAAMAPDLFRFFHAMGVRLRNIYGNSEFGLCTVHQGERYDLETVGHWLPDDGGKRLEWRVDESGELLLKGGFGFAGYHNRPEKTLERWSGEWFRTGDAVTLTADGQLVFLDRVDHLRRLSDGHVYPPQFLETRLRLSPFIRDVLIVGDGRHTFVVALVNIDYDAVAEWAERRRVAFSTYVDLSQASDVAELVRTEIESVNRLLPSRSRIVRFANLPKELDPDDGELTRTRKLRREAIERRYLPLIEGLYRGDRSVDFAAEITFRDGRRATLEARVHLVDVAAARESRAALARAA